MSRRKPPICVRSGACWRDWSNDVAPWPLSLLTDIYDSSRARGLRGRGAADDLRQRRDLTYRAVLRAPRTGRRYARTGGAHVARARPAADSHNRALARGGGRPPAVPSRAHTPEETERQRHTIARMVDAPAHAPTHAAR